MTGELRAFDDPDDPITEEEETNFRADLALVLSVGATVLLYALPWARTIAWPLVLLSTLAHELGHGIAALLVGGSFHSLLINPDASGVAFCSAQGRVANAIVSAGGLCGPAFVAAILFSLARHPKLARISLVAIGLALLATVPVLLQGTFGKVFVSIVAAVLLAIGVRAPTWLSKHACAFVAVQLALSVYSRGDYLFTPVAQMATGDMPSDVANMATNLLLPYWFWGGACAVFSVLALLVGGRLFLRGLPLPKKAKKEEVSEDPSRDRESPREGTRTP